MRSGFFPLGGKGRDNEIFGMLKQAVIDRPGSADNLYEFLRGEKCPPGSALKIAL